MTNPIEAQVVNADYEQYAKERPHFYGNFDYPDVYYRAIKGLSGTYVDVGAGDGRKLRCAIDEGSLEQFSRIIAIDIAQERVSRMQQHIPEAEARVGDAQHTLLPEQSVDFFFSDQVIEHVASDIDMAREVGRVLKRGGRGLVGSTLKGKGAWYFYRCNGKWTIDPTHVREYVSAAQYRDVFVQAGLHVDEVVLEPVRFSVTDLLLRALLTLRLVKASDSVKIYERFPFLGKLSRTTIRIPRYYLCYAIVRHA